MAPERHLLAATTLQERGGVEQTGGAAQNGRNRVLSFPVSSVPTPSPTPQYIDAISNKQGELESHVSDGYKTALTEERRRFCFLVEKQCAVAKNSAAYHSKVRLLATCRASWERAAPALS